MADPKNVLVFSAHAADFVWRARLRKGEVDSKDPASRDAP